MTTSARTMTVANTGRRTQSSASFCMSLSFYVDDAASVQVQLNAGEESRAQAPIAIGELRLGEERTGLRIDHAANRADRSREHIIGIWIDSRGHGYAGLQPADEPLRHVEPELQRRGLIDDERHAGLAEVFADVDATLGNDSVDGRAKDCVGQALTGQRCGGCGHVASGDSLIKG